MLECSNVPRPAVSADKELAVNCEVNHSARNNQMDNIRWMLAICPLLTPVTVACAQSEHLEYEINDLTTLAVCPCLFVLA